jgi:hypothetical protein
MGVDGLQKNYDLADRAEAAARSAPADEVDDTSAGGAYDFQDFQAALPPTTPQHQQPQHQHQQQPWASHTTQSVAQLMPVLPPVSAAPKAAAAARPSGAPAAFDPFGDLLQPAPAATAAPVDFFGGAGGGGGGGSGSSPFASSTSFLAPVPATVAAAAPVKPAAPQHAKLVVREDLTESMDEFTKFLLTVRRVSFTARPSVHAWWSPLTVCRVVCVVCVSCVGVQERDAGVDQPVLPERRSVRHAGPGAGQEGAAGLSLLVAAAFIARRRRHVGAHHPDGPEQLPGLLRRALARHAHVIVVGHRLFVVDDLHVPVVVALSPVVVRVGLPHAVVIAALRVVVRPRLVSAAGDLRLGLIVVDAVGIDFDVVLPLFDVARELVLQERLHQVRVFVVGVGFVVVVVIIDVVRGPIVLHHQVERRAGCHGHHRGRCRSGRRGRPHCSCSPGTPHRSLRCAPVLCLCVRSVC